MLRIHGRKNSINVQKVLWCCGELDIAFERIDVGGRYGGTDTPEYLALNPNGLVPTINDDGVVIWESNAIVRYLANKYGAGKLWPEDRAIRAASDRWMDWQIATLWANLRVPFLGFIRTPPAKRDLAAIAAAARTTGEILGILDRHLATRPFVAGESLTMGDIPIGVSIYRWFNLAIERPRLRNVEAWYLRLCDRPAYRRVVDVAWT